MREINIRELIKHKILPFNVYNEKGQVLIYSGELLTPGKILEVKDLKIFLYDENYQKKSTLMKDNPLVKRRLAEQKRKQEERRLEILKRRNEVPVVEEVFEMAAEPEPEITTASNFESIDISNFKGTVNKHSIIQSDLQLKLKFFFADTVAEFDSKNYDIALNKLNEIKDKIYTEIVQKSENLKLLSEVKLIGEYKKCHALNVAILAGIVAKSLDYAEPKIKDLILAGLLHDVGKLHLDPDLAYKKTLSIPELREYSAHTIHGYKIIRNILKLGSNIAVPALEHHELSDGSGYPRGLSLEGISHDGQIILVCNYYDNLTFNRTNIAVANSRDAVKALLDMGTKKLPPDILYTLANKFAFNDTLNFAQMIN